VDAFFTLGKDMVLLDVQTTTAKVNSIFPFSFLPFIFSHSQNQKSKIKK